MNTIKHDKNSEKPNTHISTLTAANARMMRRNMVFGSSKASTSPAFTIIELLIVIVIIGILVAITAVAYNGITKQAKEASLKSELKQAGAQLILASNQNKPLNTDSLPKDPNVTYSLAIAPNNKDFCLSATNTNINTTYNTTQAGGMNEGSCAKLLACPTNYIEVPGNSYYGTTNFCVMKYEAKNVGGVATSQATGTPWVNMNQTNAKTAAQTPGAGYHLITEPEWMTIAMNVINNPVNWSTGKVGDGFIYSGHNEGAPNNSLAASTNDSDGYSGTGNASPSNQKRTLTLSNGEVIWDLAGNVYEWTDATITGGQPGLTGQTAYAWNEYNAPTMQRNGLPTTSWPTGTSYTGSQGVGRLYSNLAEGGVRAFLRGGSWGSGSDAGVLMLFLGTAPTSASSGLGFRVSLGM